MFNAKPKNSSAIKFIQSKRKRSNKYDQLMKMNASNLEKSSIGQVLSKLIDYN